MISMEHHQHFDRSRAVASSSLSSSWLLSSSSSSTSSSSSQDGEDGTEPMQSDTFDDEDEDYASSSSSSSLRTRRSINCKARFLQQQHAMMLTPLHIQPILRRGCPVTYANVKASTNSNFCSFSSSSSMLIVECEEPDEEDLVMTTLTQSSNTYDSRAIAFSSSPLRPAFLPPRTSPTHDDDDEKQDHSVSFQDLLHTIEHDDDEDEDGDVDEEEYGIVQQGRRRRSSSTVTLLESIPEEDDATDEDTG